MLLFRSLLLAVVFLVGGAKASAHLSYRDFGVFSGLTLQSVPITGVTALNASGWADGTDEDFGNTHGLRFYKFTLQNTANVIITVDAANPANLLPGFSLYSGLGSVDPPDYETDITLAYLATLGGIQPKEGAFNALATWRMGNEDETNFADMSTFTYIGNAADGTSENYGSAPAIIGDGTADGHISGSFALPAGDYTLVVGGADYLSLGAAGTRTMSLNVTVVPEPTSATLLAGNALAFFAGRRRRKTPDMG